MTFIDKLRQCWSQIEIWKLCNPGRRKINPEGKSDMQKEMVRQENGKNAKIHLNKYWQHKKGTTDNGEYMKAKWQQQEKIEQRYWETF